MAKNDRISPIGKTGLRITVGIVFSVLIYWSMTQMLEGGLNAVTSNSKGMATITRFCNDFADSKTTDVNVKNQIASQCMREQLASQGKK